MHRARAYRERPINALARRVMYKFRRIVGASVRSYLTFACFIDQHNPRWEAKWYLHLFAWQPGRMNGAETRSRTVKCIL